MDFGNYINCLQAKSSNSGELKIFYSASGARTHGYAAEDLIFNLVHPTGDQLKTIYYNGQPNQTAVVADLMPGMSIGHDDGPVEAMAGKPRGYYHGADLVQIGYQIGYKNWSATVDITPELCDYGDGDNLSRVLFSTMPSYDSASGFYVGINQGNKLYAAYKKENSRPAVTLNSEIDKNSVINITKGDDVVSISFYNLEKQKLEQATLNIEGHPTSNKMYLGNFVQNANTAYTGYLGRINNFALFESQLSNENAISSCQCMFTTGIDVVSSTSQIFVPNVTGFSEQTQYVTGVTGYVNAIKEVTDNMGGGQSSTILVSYKSGVTGLIESGTAMTFLTGAPTVTSNTTVSSGALYDQDKLDLYNRYYLNFKNGLKSGEKIEILSFSDARDDVQLSLNDNGEVISNNIRLYNYGLFNQSKTDPTLLTNGWDEASGASIATEDAGHHYDYAVLPDKTISGLATESNSIVYDLVDASAICVDFSGNWENYSAWTGAQRFPHQAQFVNRVNLGGSNPQVDFGQVIITGISGRAVWDHHVYYNGQKLIENIDFYTGHIETGNGLSADALVITGDIAGTHIGNTYSYLGKTWGNYDDIINKQDFYTPEMCFVPKVSGEKAAEMLKTVTADANGIADPLSGFSEMVWLNGVRLERGYDYKKGKECGLTNAYTFFGENPFIFYNNNEEYLNYG